MGSARLPLQTVPFWDRAPGVNPGRGVYTWVTLQEWNGQAAGPGRKEVSPSLGCGYRSQGRHQLLPTGTW